MKCKVNPWHGPKILLIPYYYTVHIDAEKITVMMIIILTNCSSTSNKYFFLPDSWQKSWYNYRPIITVVQVSTSSTYHIYIVNIANK